MYADDFNQKRLATQLSILHSNVGLEVRDRNGGAKLKSIVIFLQSLNSVEHELYTEVIKLADKNNSSDACLLDQCSS